MLVVIAVGGKNLLEPVDGQAPASLRAGTNYLIGNRDKAFDSEAEIRFYAGFIRERMRQ